MWIAKLLVLAIHFLMLQTHLVQQGLKGWDLYSRNGGSGFHLVQQELKGWDLYSWNGGSGWETRTTEVFQPGLQLYIM